MLDLHYLKLFHVVAQTESFTKAAEILHITQPALSIQIKKLEEGLGMKLFDKSGHKVQLNSNGSVLLAYTTKIFDLVEEVTQKLVDETQLIRGEINIGGSNTPGTYILPKIIGKFKERYPHIKVNLRIGTTEEIAYLISTGGLDIAINGGYIEYGSNTHVVKLMEDSIVMVAAKDNMLALKPIQEIIETENFIIHGTSSQLYKITKDFFQEMHISNECTMAFNTIEAIKQAVEARLGIALIPSIAVKMELEMGILRTIPIKETKWTYPYSLIYNRQKYLSPANRKFVECIYEYFRITRSIIDKN